jgi:uncharacterized protein
MPPDREDVKTAPTGAQARGGDPAQSLKAFQDAAKTGVRGLPPVEKWNPPFCGDIDMRIAQDGTWFYLNSPIGRKPLVKLFASVLRREPDDGYVLVTPVEKCGIRVDDAPFVAVAMAIEGSGRDQAVTFTTNVDDEVTVDEAHPLRFATEAGTGGFKPYVLVRGRLEALVARSVFYDLVAAGRIEPDERGVAWFGLWSCGRFWRMAPAAEIGAVA